MCIVWLKPTKLLHIIGGRKQWQKILQSRYKKYVTSVSWRTLMRAKPRRPNVFYFIRVFRTRLAKCTKALLLWIGWNKNVSAVLRSPLLRLPVFGKAWINNSTHTELILLIHPGT